MDRYEPDTREDETVSFRIAFKHGKKQGRIFEQELARQRRHERNLGNLNKPMSAQEVYDRMIKRQKAGQSRLERIQEERRAAADKRRKIDEMEANMLKYGKPRPTWADKLSHFLDELTTGDVE